jgi:uncharacterized membrane protein YccC
MKIEKSSAAVFLLVFVVIATAELVRWMFPDQRWLGTIAGIVVGCILGWFLLHKGYIKPKD